MNISDCSAYDDGGCISGAVGDDSDVGNANMTLHRSVLILSRCQSQTGHGGGMFLQGSLRGHSTSQLVLNGCSARGSGGGVFSRRLSITGHTVLTTSECNSGGPGGGLFLNGTWYSESASAEFSGCTSGSDGGCAFIQTVDIAGPNSNLKFSACIARRGYGGGLFVKAMMITKHADLLFDGCTARAGGGCVAGGEADMFGGRASFRTCRAMKGDGGGLTLGGGWTLREARVDFLDAGAVGSGGGASVEDAHVSDSDVKFSRCTASFGYGGGLQVQKKLVTKNSTLSFELCAASSEGGCSAAETADVQGGLTTFGSCQVDSGSGGCLLLHGEWRSNGGNVTFENCAASADGGCASMADIRLLSPATAMTLSRCRATFGSGGGLKLKGSLTGRDVKLAIQDCTAGKHGGCAALESADVIGGKIIFNECHSQAGSGGGLLVQRTLKGTNVEVSFSQCTASEDGGCASAGGIAMQGNRQISLKKCTAGKRGGGLKLAGPGVIQSPMVFDTCSSSEKQVSAVGEDTSPERRVEAFPIDGDETSAVSGSTLYATASLKLGTVLLDDSFSIMVSSTLFVQKLDLRVSAPAVTISLEAESLQVQEVMDCSMLYGCGLRASASLHVPQPGLRCSRVSGLQHDATSTKCKRCPDNTVQLDESGAGPCMTCPRGAAVCRVDNLTLLQGFMVNASNVSHSLRCPNPSACPGGDARSRLCLTGHEGWTVVSIVPLK